MDEKAAATVLEDARFPITNEVFSFTVTADPFVGLELLEHIDHDAIAISSNSTNDDLHVRDFQRVIRSSECQIPIIFPYDSSGTTASAKWYVSFANRKYFNRATASVVSFIALRR